MADNYLARYQPSGTAYPPESTLLGRPSLPNVLPREMRTEPLGQSNLLHRLMSSFGEPSMNMLAQGFEGQATPQEIARTFLETGPMGPLGMARAPKIRGYHGSPHDFDEFVTPAFFERHESGARTYRNDGGGFDNLNGRGARNLPDGYQWAHQAIDRAGGDRARAIEMLSEDMRRAPRPEDFEPRGLLDVLLGRPARLKPDVEVFMRWQREANQSGLDYLQSGQPLGRMYEVELPRPTAHYDGDQASDIADAIAKGHKVITWGGRRDGEIIALSPEVIEILRKYGIAAPVAGPAIATGLHDYLQTNPGTP